MYWVVYSSTHRGSYVFVALLITVVAIRLPTEWGQILIVATLGYPHLIFCYQEEV